MTWNNSHQKPSLMDIQYPQPTRPFNSHAMIDIRNLPRQFSDHELRDESCATMEPIIEGDEEADDRSLDSEKLLIKYVFEAYQKLPEKLRRKIAVERYSGPATEERESERDSMAYSSRGLEGGEAEEIGLRLDRFKIRTLNPSGVVVKDETKR